MSNTPEKPCEVCGQRPATTSVVVQQLAVDVCDECKQEHDQHVAAQDVFRNIYRGQ